MRKRQILEFPLELPHPKAVGERRENIARQLCRCALQPLVFGLDDETQLLHMVGELDQHDADVLHHREQHLAQRFELGRLLLRLLRRLLAARQRAELAHAHHALRKLGNRGAEFFAQQLRVLRRDLMAGKQQRCGQRFVVKLEFGKYAGGFEDVRQHRLAAGKPASGIERRDEIEHVAQRPRLGRGITAREAVEPRGDG